MSEETVIYRIICSISPGQKDVLPLLPQPFSNLRGGGATHSVDQSQYALALRQQENDSWPIRTRIVSVYIRKTEVGSDIVVNNMSEDIVLLDSL